MTAIQGFHQQLETLHAHMNSEIRFKNAKLEELVELSLNDLELNLCPAVVFAVTRALQKEELKMLSLASLFQYIFLADKIHRLVTDGDLPEQARQYPILVGDYLFGQTFLKLCEKDLHPYLREFTGLIETMNEGVIHRWSLKEKQMTLEEYKHILSKERASVTKLAAGITAELNGAEESVKDQLESFGYHIGMAWAFSEEGQGYAVINTYLDQARADMECLSGRCLVEPLDQLYQYVQGNLIRNN
ncbi:hypothetical protein Sgly_1709 [Syntrophobotulus glycolicus DSM 8271]|uniref:Polyprenyl synthetase n=1 Tax=Syntrophobotulus glycolicus (strain DSM 8271 / FlGlyR) TaxID=645991 RepID=F0SYW9_SYNGF|nr:class 1 isoprenoid biosynthesis enzyme [Syntrophobotulus glycolicus]ADY56006.1 hypothetical protein Sgly_1709 [Syntrophobotulus glycolicus DSM 8271]